MKCSQMNRTFEDSRIFDIGPDGRVHYIEEKGINNNDFEDFCLNLIIAKADEKDSEEEWSYSSGSGYIDDLDDDSDFADEYGPSGDVDLDESQIFAKSDQKLELWYCGTPPLKLRKCCPMGQNINVKSRACTDHMAPNYEEFIYEVRSRFHISDDLIINPRDNRIITMAQEGDDHFSVTNDAHFSIDFANQILIYRNQNFSKVCQGY